jgi:hypothetical protein
MKLLQVRFTPANVAAITDALDKYVDEYGDTPDTNLIATMASHLRYRATRLWGAGWADTATSAPAIDGEMMLDFDATPVSQ